MTTRKKQSLPPTFQEGRRNYTLEIFPQRKEGSGMGSGSASAEGCLQTMTYASDGMEYIIMARYKDTPIGEGRYRKRGPSGRVETVEVIEAQGAMIGLIEAALARREEERQATGRQARARRLLPLPCPSCGHALGYDPADHLFARSSGEAVSACDYCGETLDLEQIQQRYHQRIRQLRADLQHAEDALRQVQALKRQRKQDP